MYTYLLTYLLTPWCRILFKKLIVTQLVKKYPAFLWNPKVHHRVHKCPPLAPILSQLNPVRPIDPYLPKVHFNVTIPPTPRLPSVPGGLPSIRNLRTSHAVATRDPPNMVSKCMRLNFQGQRSSFFVTGYRVTWGSIGALLMMLHYT
jgi:hypothetical protein